MITTNYGLKGGTLDNTALLEKGAARTTNSIEQAERRARLRQPPLPAEVAAAIQPGQKDAKLN